MPSENFLEVERKNMDESSAELEEIGGLFLIRID